MSDSNFKKFLELLRPIEPFNDDNIPSPPDYSNIIRTTIYLTNLKDFAKVNQIYAETFDNDVSPARACVEVSNLPKGGKIEIDCIAWLGG